jgi:hypothetical protein
MTELQRPNNFQNNATLNNQNSQSAQINHNTKNVNANDIPDNTSPKKKV